MPITGMNFVSARDIHLVRGQAGQTTQQDIRREIVVDLPNGDSDILRSYLLAHNDVAVSFRPLFEPATETLTLSRGFGIDVNRLTGQVSVAGGAAPNPSPTNFILEAAVTRNDGGPPPAGMPHTFMRVHVHQRVERIWLTPERLSIRARPGSGADEVDHSFTVRAQFDDGTVADVTDSDELTFSPSSIMDGRRIKIPATMSVGQELDVTVKTSSRWGNKTAHGKILLLKTWETETDVPNAELIEGHPKVWDGVLRPESVPNVVIVACGFPKPAEGGFQEITNSMVHRLKTDPMYQPFGYLATSMNYWRLMVPAATAGVCMRPEVRVFLHDGVLQAAPLPQPLAPPPDPTDWDVEHLIYAVGLPISSDVRLIKNSDPTQPPVTLDLVKQGAPENFTYTDLFNRWKLTARAIPNHTFDKVPAAVAHAWVVLADRTFIDEVDAFPSISIGEPPSLGIADVDGLGYHPLRGSSDGLAPMFRRVTAKPRPDSGSVIALDGNPPANALGNLWIKAPSDETPAEKWAFDNREFVVALSNTPYGRANSAIHIRLDMFMRSPENEKFLGLPVARVAGRNALTLALHMPSVAVLDDHTYESFAHELGHKLGLGDEYVEFPRNYVAGEQNLESEGNLTTTAVVLDSNNQVRLDQIKWNWDRLRKASVLTKNIVFRGNGVFHCTCARGSGLQFAVGDEVFLRKRVSGEVIGRLPVTSPVEFEVRERVIDPSDPLNITLVLQAGDPFISGPSIVVTFEPGSVIYLPVPAPSDVTPSRPFLTLVPPAAERIMAATHGTMTGPVCDLHATGSAIQTPSVADPEGKLTSIALPHVIGAYFGGALHTCGILHPAGMCMMRNSYQRPRSNAPRGVSRFCVVCSYVMVEFVNPDKHWQIDRDYGNWYPF